MTGRLLADLEQTLENIREGVEDLYPTNLKPTVVIHKGTLSSIDRNLKQTYRKLIEQGVEVGHDCIQLYKCLKRRLSETSIILKKLVSVTDSPRETTDN